MIKPMYQAPKDDEQIIVFDDDGEAENTTWDGERWILARLEAHKLVGWIHYPEGLELAVSLQKVWGKQ